MIASTANSSVKPSWAAIAVAAASIPSPRQVIASRPSIAQRVGAQQAANHADGARFTGAVRADQADRLAGLYLERHVVDSAPGAVRLGQVRDVE
jgi:hypothetical protein